MRPLLVLCSLILCVGACHAADTSLVAHWTFDEGSGSVARDLTGHGHDATLKNTQWVTSPRGHALRFDSKDDLAQYGQVPSMIMEGDITLAVWVKTDSSVAPKTHRLIFGDGGYGIERNIHFSMDGYDRLSFEWADGKTNASLLAPASLLNGSWKHVVVVASSRARRVTMYVDGGNVASMDMPLPISKAPVKERLTGWFYSGFFQGDLDDIRLYSRALSEAEVKALYISQADLQVGRGRILFDGSGLQPQGVLALPVRNFSKQVRTVELSTPAGATQTVTLKPGAETECLLGQVPLEPVWTGRTDLFIAGATGLADKVSVKSGDDRQQVPLVSQLAIEPLIVNVQEAWQRQMAAGRTERLPVEVKLTLPAAQLREDTLHLRLISHETGREALAKQVRAAQASQSLALDVRSLPWGAYDLAVSLTNPAGREVAKKQQVVTVLPGGPQQVRVLNNLVSELMNARARGLLQSRRLEFMNPRDGWVWFSASGDCSVRLPAPLAPIPGGGNSLAAKVGGPASEAMRLLPAGKHVLQVSGAPTELLVHAIPALLYNVYPSGPQITPFGDNTWERLSKATLPNTNMIEAQVVNTPEHRQFLSEGKTWIANLTAPGLGDKEEWTVEKMLAFWQKPRGWDLAGIGGEQIDEYYPGALTPELLRLTTLSIAKLSQDPAFKGKLWIPFVVNMFNSQPAELFVKTSLGCGWPYSVEVYVGEEPTETAALQSIRSRFLTVASGWERAYPNSLRRAIFTPMYAYLPYCTANRYPQADFRVHLDMQMQMLASEPAFFGLWGVQPYRSNYVDEEILNATGMLLRHYCIEGKTTRLLSDPYELRHVKDPDFEEGLKQWQVSAAETGSVSASKFTGYGGMEGRYPAATMGDTFALLKRSDKAPNVLSQQLQGLQPGRRYSVKVFSADYGDLTAGTSRKTPPAISLKIDGAELLPKAFVCPFRSARAPKPFDRTTPFWMNFHWLQFRAQSPTATLTISDWVDGKPGVAGQQTMVNFVEVQPVLETP